MLDRLTVRMPLGGMVQCAGTVTSTASYGMYITSKQGLTLVHFSAQLKRLPWDRGCTQGDFRGCLAGVRGY